MLFLKLMSKLLQRVTPWNVGKLRNAIVNGPDIHRGATQYVDKPSEDVETKP